MKDRRETRQMQILPTTHIRRPPQREGEPHGQYGTDAEKRASSVTRTGTTDRNKVNSQPIRTLTARKSGNSQLRTVIVQVDGVLTGTKCVDLHPEIFGISDHGMK